MTLFLFDISQLLRHLKVQRVANIETSQEQGNTTSSQVCQVEMRLPVDFGVAFEATNHTNATLPIPENGSCFVCNSISNDILLIQIVGFLVLLVILAIASSPLVKSRHLEVSDHTRNIYALFTIVWVLLAIVHATIKWFADPWATNPPNSPKPDLNTKQSWVQFVVTCCNGVVVLGFFTTMLIQDWMTEKFQKRFKMGKYAEGREVGVDFEGIVGEESLLLQEQMRIAGESPEIHVTRNGPYAFQDGDGDAQALSNPDTL